MSEERAREVKAVEMMRAIRDELSRKLQNMTHEEQREFMKEQLARPKAPHEEAQRSSA
jgi:hypothetical protein